MQAGAWHWEMTNVISVIFIWKINSTGIEIPLGISNPCGFLSAWGYGVVAKPATTANEMSEDAEGYRATEQPTVQAKLVPARPK